MKYLKPTLFAIPFLLLFTAIALAADGPRLADPEVLEALRATDTPGLPKNLTPGERPHLRLPDLSAVPRDPPIADYLRTASEYERNEAIIMRWGDFNSVLTEMIVPITNDDGLASVMLVVSGTAQQNSAFNTLDSAGADMDRVEFVIAPSNSVWIRDYGPRFSSADFSRVIIDHEYNRPRPLDNQIPSAIATYLGEDIYDMPISHGGGNFHLFSNGQAYMTNLILNENPGYTEQDVIDLYADYQGVDLTIVGALPASFDSTQHLDMWFLPVDDHTVIIGDYNNPPPGVNPAPQVVIDVTEDTAALMQSRDYTVLRTPGWRSSAHITYTNSVIVNDLVLICEFNGFNTQNAQALAVYEQAFPDKTIVPVNCSQIINSAGAIHCIVKHKPFAEPTFTLNLEPQAASACVPESGLEAVTVDVAVGAINDYQGTVALSAADEPAGVTSGFDPDEVIGPGATVWTLTVDDTAPAGTFPITLTGDDGEASKATVFELTLDGPLPGPDLLTPPDQAQEVDLQPEFAWDEWAGATEYRIQAALDPGFGQLVFDEQVSGAVFIPADPLDSGTAYYWRVQTQNDCGDGDWSGPREFLTRFQPGELVVAPPALDFSEVVQGQSAILAVTLSNVAEEGAAELELIQPEVIVGQNVFSIQAEDSDCGPTLAPQQSCTVAVRFAPDDYTAYTGVLRIAATGLPSADVTLAGTGVPEIPDENPIFRDRFESD